MNLKSTDPPPQPRRLSDIVYPNMKSPLAKCIRVGYLLKKTESSKSFTKGYFVLTTNYLHEFKSSDFFLDSKSPRSKNKPVVEQSDISRVNKDGTNAGSHPSSKGTQDPKLTKRRKGLSSSNLYPISSLSLNDCSLKDSTDSTFVLQGYASYHSPEDTCTKESSTTSNLACPTKTLASNKGKHQRTPSALSMVSVPKFLKSSSVPKEQKKAKEEANINKKSICEKRVEWTFKIFSASLEPTPEESKNFKKWVQDIKALTSFNSTQERSNFIEEKILKSRNHNNGKSSQRSKNSTYITPVDSFVNLSEK
ncbi:ANM_collapsed_G0058350.mRNA.1.CDS.1 [Saccharomyces cerevisiae]|nr:ANM_collapsed_G0058350.mRNA.1.CDS.1 [Saccharomyces cerevisiae]